MTPASPRQRVLIVGTGAPGGIGRVEQLTAEAVAAPDFAPSCDFTALWRRQHPDYLRNAAVESVPTVKRDPTDGGHRYVNELIRAIREVRPQYVIYMHANLARPAPWLRPIGHPASYAVWTYGVEIWNRLSWPHRHALDRASVVLTISQDSARRTVETQGVSDSRVAIIPLSLSEETFTAARPADGERGRILTVSRLGKTEGGKNLDSLIRSMASVRERHPEARLRVIGDGDGRSELESLARRAGVDDIVSFAGTLSDEELRTEYGRAELFVLPSEKEGFGLVFIEAMLAATPVLGLAKGGPLDIIRDGVDGRLISDLAELPVAIAQLLSDEDGLKRMGARAREGALARFSPSSFRQSLSTTIGLT